MTSPTDKYKDLSPQDTEFAKRLATNFAPAPLTPNQRAAFDIALAARLEKRRHRTFFVPAVATVAAAAAVLIFTLNGDMGLNPQTPAGGEPTIRVAEVPTESGMESADSLDRDEWAYDLLAFNDSIPYADESPELNELDETQETQDMYASDNNDEESDADVFPDEYLAIESIFLEG
jgi:hypothetical protein